MKLNYTFSNLCGVVYDGGNAVFTPDGKKLISPVGHRVTVFDLATNAAETLPLQTASPIEHLAVSPNGTLLLVVDADGRAILASLRTHATLTFLRMGARVTAAPRFSPDNAVVAIAIGRKIEVWRVPDFATHDRQFAPWQLVQRIVQHQGDIVSVQWSGEDVKVGSVRRGMTGRWLATASEDLTCRVFKIEYRQQAVVTRVLVRGASKRTVAMDIDDGDGNGSAAPTDDTEVQEEEEEEEGASEPHGTDKTPTKKTKSSSVHHPLVISVHRHQPVLAAFHVVDVADAVDTQHRAQHHAQHPAQQVFLLTLSREGALFVWDFDANRGRLRDARGQKHRIAISENDDDDNSTPTGQHNSVTNVSSTGRPERWARLRSVAFRDGRLLVGFTDGIFGLFRIDPLLERVDRLHALSLFNSTTVANLTPGHGIDTCDLDASGDWLAFGSAKTGQLLVWEWPTESYIFRQTGVTRGHVLGLTCSAYASDGRFIATGSGDGRIRLWTGDRGGECAAVFSDHVGPITALAFTKQGHVLVSASQDGTVRAYDVLRFRPFKQLVPPEPRQFVSLAVDVAGELVAAGTLDTHEIFVWSLQTGQIVEVFGGHTGPVVALAFEPTRGRLLASGSWDHSVRIWDVYANPDSKAHGDPLLHETDVLALSFRPDGAELSVSTLAGTILTWSVEGGMVLSTIDGRLDIATRSLAGAAFHSICHSPDGTCILAAGSFPAVALYHLPTRTLLKHFPLRAHRSPDTAVTSGKGLLQPFLETHQSHARSVLFSPTGQSWSCLTDEGLLIYAINDAVLFDPFDLTPDLTPDTVLRVLGEGAHLHALVLALRLNVASVSRVVWAAIPGTVVPLAVTQLPRKYLLPLLNLLATLVVPDAFPDAPFPIERLFLWISAVFNHHAAAIKQQRVAALPVLRVLHKAALAHYADLALVVRDNVFEIERILLAAVTL